MQMASESKVADTKATATTTTLLSNTRCMVCGSVEESEPMCHFTADSLSISGEALVKDRGGGAIKDVSVHIRCGMMAQYKGKPKYEIQNVRGVYNKHRHDPLYQAAIKRTRKTMAVTAVDVSDGPTSGSSPSLKDEREFCLVSEFADSIRRLELELIDDDEANVREKRRNNRLVKKNPRKNAAVVGGRNSSQKRKRRHSSTDDASVADAGGDQDGAGGESNIDGLSCLSRHRKERSIVEEALTYYKSQRIKDQGAVCAGAAAGSNAATNIGATFFQAAATTTKTGALTSSSGSSLAAGDVTAAPAAKVSRRESEGASRVLSSDNNVSVSFTSGSGENVEEKQLALKDQEISVLRRLLDKAIAERRTLEHAMSRHESGQGDSTGSSKYDSTSSSKYDA